MHPKTVLRARGTLFWLKVAREPTKINETYTNRSEIARGIVSNRSRGPEMHKMTLFSKISAIDMALQPPHHGNRFSTYLVTEMRFRRQERDFDAFRRRKRIFRRRRRVFLTHFYARDAENEISDALRRQDEGDERQATMEKSWLTFLKLCTNPNDSPKKGGT